MMHVLTRIRLMLLFTLCVSTTYAAKDKAFSPLEDEIIDYLPPMTQLIDSAIGNDPYVRMRNIQLFIDQCKLKSIKTEWTQHLGALAEFRYGSYDTFTSSGGGSVTTPASNDIRWNYSTYINIPLRSILNRKNQINQSKLEMKQSQSMLDVQREEVKKIVVRQYNDLVLKQKLLKITSKAKETLEISMQLAEKSFTNGALPMGDYAMITQNYTRAAVDFATAEVEFQNAYQLLEILCGTSLNIINQTSDTHETK